MKKVLLVALILGLFVGIGQAQSITSTPFVCDDGKVTYPQAPLPVDKARGSLTTHYLGGNGFCGNTFDILPVAGLTLTDMDVHWSTAGELLNVEIYWKSGTSYGFETTPGAWTLLASVSGVTAAGLGLPTNLGGFAGAPTFNPGETYGIAFYVSNYDVLAGSIQYTNGGPIVYSNTEVTLTTHAGLSFPIFTGLFYPREFNGAIYYTSGPVPASVDVKVNGEDAGVVINDGTNVEIDIKVFAGIDAGTDSDVWVLVKNDAGKRWSYNKAAARWFRGWCFEYVSEPLDDHDENVLDLPLPIGGYDAYVGIDTDMNGMLNIGSILVYDHCDFEVVPYTPPLWDNGDTDGSNGVAHSELDLFGAGTGYRKLLDDFVVSGGPWTINGMNSFNIYFYGALVGLGWELEILDDAAGTPGVNVATAATVGYVETYTGRTWFGLPEFDADYDFSDIVLADGTYWIKYNVDAPDGSGENCYTMVHANTIGSEIWCDYTYDAYYGPGTGVFGSPYDVSFQLQGF